MMVTEPPEGVDHTPETAASEGEPAPGTPAEPYSVGRGKPPVHTRFQPGQSGNREGRPRRSHNLTTLVREALHQTVDVQVRGRRRVMTKLQALVQVNLQKAINGDPRSTQTVLTLMRSANLLQDELAEHRATAAVLEPEDQAILESFLQRAKDKPE